MKNKKKQGQRFRSLFDELDLKILYALFDKPQGVLSLTKELNVEHKTLKKHIDKLENYKFVYIEKLKQNKKHLDLIPQIRKFLKNYKEEVGILVHLEFDDKHSNMLKKLSKEWSITVSETLDKIIEEYEKEKKFLYF